MAGVWEFDGNGVMRLVQEQSGSTSGRKMALVHLPSGQVVSSYSLLEQILKNLGWERYNGGHPTLLQFHKHSANDLISVPRNFSRFSSIHMYDIAVKNPNVFHVQDI